MHLVVFVQFPEHALGLFEELHGFGCLGTVFHRSVTQPQGAARVTAVDVCNAGKARLESPSMEEVYPIDIVSQFVYLVRENHKANFG